MIQITDLWIGQQHQQRYLGIGDSRPSLSWRTNTGAQQNAYEVELTSAGGLVSTAGEVSFTANDIPWPFEPLRSREIVNVRVRVTDDAGSRSRWSDSIAIEAGLLRPADWTSDFVSPSPAAAAPSDAARTAYLMRAEFQLRSDISSARAYVSAHGVYELECNGALVGDEVLAPGWTSYTHRLRYQTYDLTDLLQPGPNAVGVWLADGWYRGRLGFNGGVWDNYGTDLSLLTQLEVNYRDGTCEIVPLDRLWRYGPGPITGSGFYEGEHYDARREQPGFSRPGHDDGHWSLPQILPRSGFGAQLEPRIGPPIRRIEELKPAVFDHRPGGRIRLDFGQNISGRLKIHVDGPAGHVVELHHAEVLELDELGIRPLRSATSVDTYICNGQGPVWWEPRFTLHGFRYAEIQNWPGDFTPDQVAAVVIHSDLVPAGWFETSDPMLNQLHSNIIWSMRDNFVDLPTDCPQRDERLGWTGDIQIFAPAASYLFDVHGILTSWLADLAAEQAATGTVPNFVPWIECGFPPQPAAAWGDAAVIVPWVLYQNYGDTETLRRQYPSMCAWIRQVQSLVDSDGLWREGFQLGDWLDPTAPPANPSASRTDRYLVASAYRIRSLRIAAQAGSVLGYRADAEAFSSQAATAASAFSQEWITPRGRMASDTVTAYALAITFDLLTPAQRKTAGTRLAHLVEVSDFTITTGFVGTPLVCDALVDTGNADYAIHLLMQRQYPSWMYPVTMGATTMWERWDSILPDGTINPGEMTSFNHYALGAVADFIHRRIAGLAPAAPGWRKIKVAPVFGAGLLFARAAHDTPQGRVSIYWQRTDQMFELDLTVPNGTSATVELPDGTITLDVGPGVHHFTSTCRAPQDDPTAPRTFNIHDPAERAARLAAETTLA